jgi:hypothetical protein
MAEEISFYIGLPIVVGIIIGIIEAYFVYEDENMASGKDFLGDMWHGLIFSVLGVFVSTNVPWLISQGWIPNFLENWLFIDENGISWVICTIVTIIMLTKMVASHAIKGISGNGFKEKFWHKLVVAVAIGFSPYYIFALIPIIEGVLPEWIPL